MKIRKSTINVCLLSSPCVYIHVRPTKKKSTQKIIIKKRGRKDYDYMILFEHICELENKKFYRRKRSFQRKKKINNYEQKLQNPKKLLFQEVPPCSQSDYENMNFRNNQSLWSPFQFLITDSKIKS